MRSLSVTRLASILLSICAVSGVAAAADGGLDAGADADADADADASADADVDASQDAATDAAEVDASDASAPKDASDFEVVTYRPDTGMPGDEAGTGATSGGCSCELTGADGSTLFGGAGPACAIGALGIALASVRRRRRHR